MKRFWNWLVNALSKDDEKLVAIFKMQVFLVASRNETGSIIVNCFESRKGKRRWTARSTMLKAHKDNSPALRNNVRKLEGFEAIEAWVFGAHSPLIPAYADMNDIEFASRLSGQESVKVHVLG